MKSAFLLAVLMVGIAVGQTGGGSVTSFTPPDDVLSTKPLAKPAPKKPAVSLHSITACSGCGTVTDLGPCTADWCDIRIDVPAIQETRKEACKEALRFLDKCDVQHWTCAEKSRILEHDESTPPKYWCRKVQP